MTAVSSYRANGPYLPLILSLLLFTLPQCRVPIASAQTVEPQVASSRVRIAQELELIRLAEREHRPDAEQAALWMQLAAEYHYAADFLKAEDAYNKTLHLLKNIPAARAEYANTLEDLAALYLNYSRVDDAEKVRKQAFAVQKKLGNRSDIGLSEVHLADIAYARHQYKKAEELALRGMNEMDPSNPPRVGMISALITVSYSRCFRGHCGEGLTTAQQADTFAKTHFEARDPAVGFALETLGFAEWKNGATQEGEKAMLAGIGILRTTLVPTDPRLGGALLQYQDYLLSANRRVEAQEIHDQVDRMSSQAGSFCSSCTVSVYSLSKTLR